MKILIAEDEWSILEGLTSLTKKWGFEPVPAVDGREAWQELQKPDAPKLLLLDWMMPHMNGVDICRSVREQEKGKALPAYIILLTSLEAKKNIIEGFEAGTDDYIIKPFDADELKARLNVGRRMTELQTELNRVIKTLTYQAIHDPLTRTYNRNYIYDLLGNEIKRAKREMTSLSVGLIDIDRFKTINDNYGHQAGDEVLIEVIHRVKNNLRDYDLLGRLGGDEFLLVNSGGSPQNINSFYNRICDTVSSEQISSKHQGIAVTVSIGATLFSGDYSADDLIAMADKALYQAKKQGRNQVVVL